MIMPCAAGRTLGTTDEENRFWHLPCPNEGTDTLIVNGDDEEPGFIVELCRAHIISLNPERIR